MEKWAERIKELADAKGVSDSELARACKTAQPSVHQWFNESPKGKPPTKMIKGDNLVAAARALNTTPEWIISGTGPKVASQSAGLSVLKLQVAIVSVRKAAESAGLEIDEVQAAAAIAWAYGQLHVYPETMTKDEMRDFDGIVRHHLRGGQFDEESERPVARRGTGEPAAAAPAKAKAGRGRG